LDSATNPLKPIEEREAAANKPKGQKQLLIGYTEEASESGIRVPPPPPAYVPPKELKKQRKMNKGGAELNNEAGSEKEYRQQQ
jgi:hypothetical protein